MSFPLPYVSTLQKLVAIRLLEEEIFRFLSLSRDLMWAGGQGNMWRHGRIHVTISHQLAKFHGQRSCQRGYVTLLVCHMITIPHHVDRGSCDSISPQSAMFGGYRPCGRGNFKFSICHRTSLDHVVRGSSWVSFPHHKSPLWQVYWPLASQKRRYFVFNLSRDLMWSCG